MLVYLLAVLLGACLLARLLYGRVHRLVYTRLGIYVGMPAIAPGRPLRLRAGWLLILTRPAVLAPAARDALYAALLLGLDVDAALLGSGDAAAALVRAGGCLVAFAAVAVAIAWPHKNATSPDDDHWLSDATHMLSARRAIASAHWAPLRALDVTLSIEAPSVLVWPSKALSKVPDDAAAATPLPPAHPSLPRRALAALLPASMLRLMARLGLALTSTLSVVLDARGLLVRYHVHTADGSERLDLKMTHASLALRPRCLALSGATRKALARVLAQSAVVGPGVSLQWREYDQNTLLRDIQLFADTPNTHLPSNVPFLTWNMLYLLNHTDSKSKRRHLLLPIYHAWNMADSEICLPDRLLWRIMGDNGTSNAIPPLERIENALHSALSQWQSAISSLAALLPIYKEYFIAQIISCASLKLHLLFKGTPAVEDIRGITFAYHSIRSSPSRLVEPAQLDTGLSVEDLCVKYHYNKDTAPSKPILRAPRLEIVLRASILHDVPDTPSVSLGPSCKASLEGILDELCICLELEKTTRLLRLLLSSLAFTGTSKAATSPNRVTPPESSASAAAWLERLYRSFCRPLCHSAHFVLSFELQRFLVELVSLPYTLPKALVNLKQDSIAGAYRDESDLCLCESLLRLQKSGDGAILGRLTLGRGHHEHALALTAEVDIKGSAIQAHSKVMTCVQTLDRATNETDRTFLKDKQMFFHLDRLACQFVLSLSSESISDTPVLPSVKEAPLVLALGGTGLSIGRLVLVPLNVSLFVMGDQVLSMHKNMRRSSEGDALRTTTARDMLCGVLLSLLQISDDISIGLESVVILISAPKIHFAAQDQPSSPEDTHKQRPAYTLIWDGLRMRRLGALFRLLCAGREAKDNVQSVSLMQGSLRAPVQAKGKEEEGVIVCLIWRQARMEKGVMDTTTSCATLARLPHKAPCSPVPILELPVFECVVFLADALVLVRPVDEPLIDMDDMRPRRDAAPARITYDLFHWLEMLEWSRLALLTLAHTCPMESQTNFAHAVEHMQASFPDSVCKMLRFLDHLQHSDHPPLSDVLTLDVKAQQGLWFVEFRLPTMECRINMPMMSHITSKYLLNKENGNPKPDRLASLCSFLKETENPVDVETIHINLQDIKVFTAHQRWTNLVQLRGDSMRDMTASTMWMVFVKSVKVSTCYVPTYSRLAKYHHESPEKDSFLFGVYEECMKALPLYEKIKRRKKIEEALAEDELHQSDPDGAARDMNQAELLVMDDLELGNCWLVEKTADGLSTKEDDRLKSLGMWLDDLEDICHGNAPYWQSMKQARLKFPFLSLIPQNACAFHPDTGYSYYMHPFIYRKGLRVQALPAIWTSKVILHGDVTVRIPYQDPIYKLIEGLVFCIKTLIYKAKLAITAPTEPVLDHSHLDKEKGRMREEKNKSAKVRFHGLLSLSELYLPPLLIHAKRTVKVQWQDEAFEGKVALAYHKKKTFVVEQQLRERLLWQAIQSHQEQSAKDRTQAENVALSAHPCWLRATRLYDEFILKSSKSSMLRRLNAELYEKLLLNEARLYIDLFKEKDPTGALPMAPCLAEMKVENIQLSLLPPPTWITRAYGSGRNSFEDRGEEELKGRKGRGGQYMGPSVSYTKFVRYCLFDEKPPISSSLALQLMDGFELLRGAWLTFAFEFIHIFPPRGLFCIATRTSSQ